MIRTEIYSVFEGPVCGKEKHDALSPSRYFVVSELNVFFVNRSRRIGAARKKVSRQVYRTSYLQFHQAHGDGSSKRILCI